MVWEQDVRAMQAPVLIITGDADAVTLEHSTRLFRLLGGGVMGDLGRWLPGPSLHSSTSKQHGRLLHRALELTDAQPTVTIPVG